MSSTPGSTAEAQSADSTDYRALYNLENYLFETVRPRFHAQGELSAFDFLCIVVWKANRAKSKIAKKLLRKGYVNLEDAVGALTGGLAQQMTREARLRYLFLDWEFALPMATAILTVLWPEEFSIYDWRVCEAVGGFEDLSTLSKFERLWPRYGEYVRAVQMAAPAGLSLRDADRHLWGLSFARQLQRDVASGFTSVSNLDSAP